MALDSGFPAHLLHYVYQVASHVLPALRRTGLYRKTEGFNRVAGTHLMEVWSGLLEKQGLLEGLTEDYEMRQFGEGVGLLVAGVDLHGEGFHLLQHHFTLLELYTKLIYPHFTQLQRHLYRISSDPNRCFLF
jgi:hypothetical protein